MRSNIQGGSRADTSSPVADRSSEDKGTDVVADVEKDPPEVAVDSEQIPNNNMKIIIPAFMLTVFLGALDQTIVAVSMPKIVEDIGGESSYSWVGSAYLLMSACMNPLYGKLSDITGRKPILFFSIGMFLLGSVLCGAAQNFLWLAICRGLQGIGGGGSTQMVLTTISDITSLHERSKYTGIMGATFGIASVAGPLVGGILTDHASWRWCFWINLPSGGISTLLLLYFLHLKPTRKRSIREVVSKFDFWGLFLLTSGVILVLFGFQGANTSLNAWTSPKTLVPLVVGVILLVSGSINEIFTSKEPIIPPRLFKTRTTTACLICVFIHGFVFFCASYYMPLYFQIRGASATMAGVRQMPLSLGGSITSIAIGIVLAKMRRYRPIMWAGTAIMTLGVGLLVMLDEKTSIVRQELWLLVVGVGVGFLFQAPLIALHAAMPVKDMATSTAAYTLLRTLGGTVGISVGNTIFQSELSKRLREVPSFPGMPISELTDYTTISRIKPDSLRQQVGHAFTRSIATIYIVCTPLAFVSFVLVLTIREYSLRRNCERQAGRDGGNPAPDPSPPERSGGDIEKAAMH